MLDHWWLAAALIVLGLLLFPYVLGPVLIYFVQRFTVPTEIVRIDPRTQPLPESVRSHFAACYDALHKLGFELVGVIALPRMIPNVQAIAAFYANRGTCVLGNTTFIVAQSIPNDLTLHYVEFITRMKDGTLVQTNNSPQIGAFKTPPQVHTAQFWDIQDLDRLHELHRFFQAKHQTSQAINRLDDEFLGDLEKYVATAAIEEVFAYQESVGYLARTPTGYRPTVVGAFLLTWQELWPFKAMRKVKRQRFARQLQQEFQLSKPMAMQY